MGRPRKHGIDTNRGPYHFRGAIAQAMQCRDGEVMLSGAAGTGKSLAMLLKLHIICEQVPGVRCLIVRKTRSSLSESGMVTLENKVIPPRHFTVARGGARRMRHSYKYSNGSEIIVGGMDDPAKIMSTEYDVIFCQEATELREGDWENLITRLRNNVLPYQQIMGDCNPDGPSHWIKRRADSGKLRLFHSRHEDNPALYDAEKGEWTDQGRQYLTFLDNLTGVRKQRLREGKWVQAEGVVFPEFDQRLHVVHPHEVFGEHPYPPPDWYRYWVVDFGHTNPFVWLCCAMDHDGRLFFYKEIYRTATIIEDHAKEITRLWREEGMYWARVRKVPVESSQIQIGPRMVVCDHDAEDRATLERHTGITTIGARKYVRKGIQTVSEMLRGGGNGPRIFFVSNMLSGEDGLLVQAKKPTSTVQEFGCYVWDTRRDEPCKEFDHGMDAVRYLVTTVCADHPWEPPQVIDVARLRTDGGAQAGSVIETGRAGSAVNPEPRIRWGESMPADRRGGRLFGGEG